MGAMEVDNVQDRNGALKVVTLKRAIDTVTRATEQDMEGMYEEAVTLYDSALSDFDSVISQEKSQVVRDCVLSKMDAYAHRSSTLKKFLHGSRSPSSDAGSLGVPDGDDRATETSASSDSGVDDVTPRHDLSADSAAEEPQYATICEPRQHQQQSRQQFLDACAEQVEQLLRIIRDEHESEEIRQRARERCEQILDFSEAYRRDFCPEPAAGGAAEAGLWTRPEVARTVSVASSVVPADTRQLVHAEVLLSAEPDQAEEDGCPCPPEDGSAEFQPLTSSIDSLRFADESPAGRSDSPDYATVRRATPSPRKHLSQVSLNKIETEAEPLLDSTGPGCAVLPVTAQRRPANKWWRRKPRADPQPEPLNHRLAEPSIFWLLLGSICG